MASYVGFAPVFAPPAHTAVGSAGGCAAFFLSLSFFLAPRPGGGASALTRGSGHAYLQIDFSEFCRGLNKVECDVPEKALREEPTPAVEEEEAAPEPPPPKQDLSWDGWD